MSAHQPPLTAPAAQRWQRARARVSRTHHPDLGGDVETYLAELARVDAEHGVGPAGTTFVSVHRDPTLGARISRTTHRAGRLVRRVRAAVARRGPRSYDL